MTRRESGLPPATVIEAALRKITETLTAVLAGAHSAAPRATAAPPAPGSPPAPATPDWSDLEWNLAKGVAAMHGISSLLCRALSWQGRRGWAAFLEEQRAHTANRQRRIIELQRRIDERARADGLELIALKGAALHALGVYQTGDRPMADLDLLVRPQDAERAVRMLESLQYRESCVRTQERTFAPPAAPKTAALGEHSENPVKIELHDRISKELPYRATDISEFIFPLRPRPGVSGYPSLAALMLHLLLHAAGSMSVRSLRLVQLHDLALLAPRMMTADWEELLEYRAARPLWWAWPPLELMLRYYASSVPVRVSDALRSDCPPRLIRIHRHRLVSDVSYSHLWVDAFPGIEWSHSLPEMVRYAFLRIRPSAHIIAMRGEIATHEAWASDPEWSGLSQTRRVLTWLTLRPTRPVTMHVVRAVLGAR
jgi:hypothetical protein